MALKLNEKYPGYMNAPSIDYPQGSFKNRTSPTAEDGSYFDQDWANDIQGFTQSLIQSAGVTPNGNVDRVGASQYFDALKAVIKSSAATETIAGVAKIATQAKVIEGTNDIDFVTPKKIKDSGLWPIGINQTLKNITSTFAKNTIYTNTTGRTIALFLCTADTGAGANSLWVDDIQVGQQDTASATAVTGQMFAIIKNGQTYEWRATSVQTIVSCAIIN